MAYDGAPFIGWQSQPGGNTVQDHLEAALSEVCKCKVAVVGAGRTDAGVHALRQCAHADVPALRMDARAWRLALNNRLPAAIRVVAVATAPADFHARFDAVSKHYRYTICHADTLPPHEAGRAWLVPWRLDVDIMRQACSLLVGTRDFRRLSAIRKSDHESSVRTITRATLARQGSRVVVDIEGGGFLYKMVRIIVAMLVRVGTGRMSVDEFAELLLNPSGRRATHCAPPDGLTLVDVRYRCAGSSRSNVGA